DEKFFENVTGAISNGVHVGVYFFTQAVNAAEAVEEANYICNKTQGLNIDLPVVIDTEELYADGMSCRHNNISVEVRTAVIKAFCEQVIARGYTPMIYGSTSWLEDMLDMSKLPYDVWVAQYYKTCQYEGDYSFWQYTENGIVKGIDGYVDMNEWCG
ncbi:MAG: Lyzozyme M1 (1,4-beta-N-acetylmuramidase), partial [Firmicutes bacterium]|nr:Lyzozyme M1 (1,4-beta-N-acetylmuramidase) [Bacillota bacterium]